MIQLKLNLWNKHMNKTHRGKIIFLLLGSVWHLFIMQFYCTVVHTALQVPALQQH